MSDTNSTKTQPLQAYLSQKHLEITCELVLEDESINTPPVHPTRNLRGAQRELTGWLVSQGYIPVGRWTEAEEDGDGYRETSRMFQPGPEAQPIPTRTHPRLD
jgi:hypothetical protein